MTDSLVKQPSENRLYTMDFTSLLGSPEVINGIVSVTQEEWDENTDSYVASTDLTLSSSSYGDTETQVRIEDGEDGKTYKVTFRVNTDANNELEGEGILAVVDL